MTRPHDLLAAAADGVDPGPFALLRREGADHLELFTGTVRTADRLADIPLPDGRPARARWPWSRTGRSPSAASPASTTARRCCACAIADAGAIAAGRRARRAARRAAGRSTGGGFDIADDEYAAIVGRVLADEIGRGEGANFVIHRTFAATVDGDAAGRARWPRFAPAAAARAGRVLDVPGAHRHPHARRRHPGTARQRRRRPGGDEPDQRHLPVPGAGADRAGLLRFLADPKEIDELYMVLDEELKMMAAVAEHGGQVVGPYLKEMAQLAHTEYLLAGRSPLDVREVLRETMFAPTVTGSPLENACRVIARHERRGRGYYGGVLALIGHDDAGPADAGLADPDPHRRHRPGRRGCGCRSARPWCAHSDRGRRGRRDPRQGGRACSPRSASAVRRRRRPGATRPTRPASPDPAVRAALAARNDRPRPVLARPAPPGAPRCPALAGRPALIVDAEDTFTAMLAHQLRALGLEVDRARRATRVRPGWTAYDLVVRRPRARATRATPADPKMAALRALLAGLLAAGRPAARGLPRATRCSPALLGLPLHRRDGPYQGVPAGDRPLRRGPAGRLLLHASPRWPPPTGVATAYGAGGAVPGPGGRRGARAARRRASPGCSSTRSRCSARTAWPCWPTCSGTCSPSRP